MSRPYHLVQMIFRYLRFRGQAHHSKGHGVHSPFVFDFITDVMNDRGQYYYYGAIEGLRESLLRRREKIEVEDMGAGSATGAGRQRRIGEIARNAAKPARIGQLLFRIANYYQPRNILELGTSLGLSTAYLAAGNLNASVVSIEGSQAIAAIARENFRALGLPHIRVEEGNFDRVLPDLLKRNASPDLVFVDGNHRLEPTLAYFEQLLSCMSPESIIIFDDIHWSPDMELAWQKISADNRVMLSIDLFFIGLVFINPAFKVKQHFRIRF